MPEDKKLREHMAHETARDLAALGYDETLIRRAIQRRFGPEVRNVAEAEASVEALVQEVDGGAGP